VVAPGRLGQAAYQAYGEQVGWRNFTGGRMPSWENLPVSTQQGWEQAALAVVRQVDDEARAGDS